MTARCAPLILVVDDDPQIRTTLAELLRSEGYRVTAYGDLAGGLAHAARHALPDAALVDVYLPDGQGLELLTALRGQRADIPVIMISGQSDITIAIQATRDGAFDFIEKPFSAERVLVALRNALHLRELSRENRALRTGESPGPQFIALSRVMTELLADVSRVAPREVPVLIQGESGTGKELIARMLHERGPRPAGPFVTSNIAAVASTLIESELFGHESGSFTGARKRHHGLVERAHGGTLFLDEIGELTAATQVKLLRIVEAGRLERVGGEKEIIAQPRIVAATNRNLHADVVAGRFRGDLYHRIAVVVLHVPPLRQRHEDIRPLAEHFIHTFCSREGQPPRGLSDDAVAFLETQRWPGNVRELSNLMIGTLIFTQSDPVRAADLQRVLRARRAADAEVVGETTGEGTDPPDYAIRIPRDATMSDAERALQRQHLLAALETHGWNVSRAAQRLGWDRTHCHRKMREFGITRPQSHP